MVRQEMYVLHKPGGRPSLLRAPRQPKSGPSAAAIKPWQPFFSLIWPRVFDFQFQFANRETDWLAWGHGLTRAAMLEGTFHRHEHKWPWGLQVLGSTAGTFL